MPNFAYDIDNSATISSTSLNIILTDNFTHTRYSFSGFNNFSNLAISTDGTFTNNNTINLDGNLTITANSFTNTGGVLNSDTFALSVAGDFDYTKKGTITTNAFNLNVGGDFSNNDSANDFTWGANDTLTVLGSADITTDSFNNSGTISANTTLNTTVSSTANNSFTNTGGVLSADTVSLSVAGDFDYVAELLLKSTTLIELSLV